MTPELAAVTPELAEVTLADAPGRPLVVLGPSLGTGVEALWSRCAARLRGRYHVVGWDLPGHGDSPPASAGFEVADLARGVLAVADQVRPGGVFRYAGNSVGGAVGLQLLLDAPERVAGAVLLATAAKFGEAPGWLDRAAVVRGGGPAAVVAGSARRWFAPGFHGRQPLVAQALLGALRGVDGESYALVCEALAGFDVRDRLGEVIAPVLAVAGGHDEPTPPADLARIAAGVRRGRLVTIDDAAHLLPAECPDAVAALIDEHLAATVSAGEVRAAGAAVRRAVLGDAYVDRAEAAVTPFSSDFSDLITEYAWGGIWTRPGLDRRSRSLITLTALVALGHHEELAMHVRAARTNGLTNDEIKEALLQTAVYCGVPAANAAFRIAGRVLSELDVEDAADGRERRGGTASVAP